MRAIVLVALAAVSAPAYAHDYWLEPETFRLSPGERLQVHLFVGDRLDREARTFDPARTTRLAYVDAAGSRDLLRIPRILGRRALVLAPGEPGTAAILLDRAFASITMTGEEFSDYLEHEGLEGVAVPDTAEVRERYARCLKTLVQVGNRPSGDLHARPFGQKLEIIFEENPYTLASGDSLGMVLRFDGEPLGRHRWMLLRESPEGEVSSAAGRTDASGRGTVRIEGPGLHVVRALHLLPCAGCENADWEIWWASVSFGVR